MTQFNLSGKGEKMITQLLRQRVISETKGARLAQGVCFAAACLVPALVFRRFESLEFTELELLLGVTTTMSLAVLLVVMGLLIRARHGGV